MNSYRFGAFVFNVDPCELRADGRAIALPRKNLEVLRELVVAEGRLVPRDELVRAVWPDTVVEEATLRQNIYTIRSMLREIDGGREYVETVPKGGYRLAVPVERLNGQPAASAPAPQSLLTRRAYRIFALVAMCVLVAGLGARAWFTSTVAPAPGADVLSVSAWKLLDSRDPEHFPAVDALFDDILRRDPRSAMAHGGKAVLYTLEDREQAAEQEAEKARQINPAIGFPFAVRGFSRMMYHWDWKAAGVAFRELDQAGCGEPVCRQWYALYQALTGDFQSAIRTANSAVELNQSRVAARAQRAQILYWAGETSSAIQEAETVVEAGGVWTHARYHLWKSLFIAGERRRAADTVLLALEPSWYRLGLGDHFQALQSDVNLRGQPEFWTRLYRVEQRHTENPYILAEIAMAANDRDTALTQLELCARTRNFFLPFAKREPLFAPLRGDPRYEKVMRALGL